MKEKTYLRLLQGGIIASLLIVFFVFKDLLFPYITSKQLSFNILTEIMFAFWLVFVLRFPKYRPRKNYITYGLMAYFVAILMSCAVSVDINLSFWGDAERMLSVFHILHFFLFYLMLISVFRSWSDFKLLFMSSAAVATVVSLMGLFGAQTYATIGNTAYVSGYLIFNLFFVVILFFREMNKQLRWLYILPFGIMLVEFWNCHTSGAIIGLFLSLLLFFFLLGLTHNSKKLRRLSLISFFVVILVVVGIFSQNKADWFQKSFLKNLTTQKYTFQTRLLSWKSAALDFKYHPIFGTGFGNYAIIFDKHFDPKFLNYTTTETYFDRAHNNLIDIASTAGLVGLLAYLSIFVAALLYLFSEMKKNGWRSGTEDLKHRKNLEILVIISLLAAYFVQNLAIFDSLVTYVGLMITLGFIYSLVMESRQTGLEVVEGKSFIKSQSAEIAWLIVLVLTAYIFIVNYNIKTYRMFTNVIKGYSQILSGNLDQGFETFKSSLKGKPMERDGRVVFINLFTSNPGVLKTLAPAKAQEIIDYAVSLAEKNVSYSAKDSLMQMQLAQVYDMSARFFGNDDLEKFNYYSAQALAAIEMSIEASPRRVPIYLVKAQMQIMRSETDQAMETVKYAINLNPNYFEGYCRLAQFDMYLEIKDNSFKEALNKCLDLGGADNVNSGTFLSDSISYYVDAGDYPRAIKLAERLANVYQQDPEIRLNLAKLYLIVGNQASSAAILKEAYALKPALAADWQTFVEAVSASGDSSSDTSSSPKK